MTERNEREIEILNRLSQHYFSVLPAEYRTYCSLTAEVSRRVLLQHGIRAVLMPCQVWHSRPSGTHHVVGFVGRGSSAAKWDGHVVCATPGFIIDAALHHFEREFQLPVPPVVVASRNQLSSQSIAVTTLSTGDTLLWLNPPPLRKGSLRIPQSPEAVVSDLTASLSLQSRISP